MTGKDLRKHFSGRPAIVTTGIQLYEALEQDDTGYAGDLSVTHEGARILKIGDCFAWIGFEDVPASYLREI